METIADKLRDAFDDNFKITDFFGITNHNKSGCRVVNGRDGAESVVCGNSKCTDACVTALKTKVAAINAEIAIAKATNKTEVAAAETKYKVAKKSALDKITESEVISCNSKCSTNQ